MAGEMFNQQSTDALCPRKQALSVPWGGKILDDLQPRAANLQKLQVVKAKAKVNILEKYIMWRFMKNQCNF